MPKKKKSKKVSKGTHKMPGDHKMKDSEMRKMMKGLKKKYK